MKIFDRDTINEAAKLPNGEEFIFEYVAAGTGFQDIGINYEGKIYYKTDSSYTDAKTGQALDCYYLYDENDERRVVVRRTDGGFELK